MHIKLYITITSHSNTESYKDTDTFEGYHIHCIRTEETRQYQISFSFQLAYPCTEIYERKKDTLTSTFVLVFSSVTQFTVI